MKLFELPKFICCIINYKNWRILDDSTIIRILIVFIVAVISYTIDKLRVSTRLMIQFSSILLDG